MPYIILFVVFLAVALHVYFRFNKGMARNARGQQTRRLVVAALLSVLPIAVAGGNPLCPSVVLLALICMLWMATYPLLFHLTNRHSSPDYENYMDIDFGLYFFGSASGIILLLSAILPGSTAISVIVGLVETVVVAVPLFQIAYFVVYRTCIDPTGMGVILDTNRNEILEFFRSFSWWQLMLALVATVVPAVVVLGVNILFPPVLGGGMVRILLLLGLTVFLTVYTWKPHHGTFVRTGLYTLYSNVKEHNRSYSLYKEKNAERMKHLEVEPLGKQWSKPSTVILVIGESACRDYMSAFNPSMEHDTTPWLRKGKADDRHFFLFPHAYSCAVQTVPSLTRALTECNQYNDKKFYDSCSFIDIAHKLGYCVHWYSNQGHLGAAETPITIIADTAEVDKWTQQEVGKVQYDETLLSFFTEIDPSKNNLIVFHLKGSHFNFQNRYPREFTRWGDPDVQDNVLCYENSIAYTDSVLERIYDYASKKLNLQAMVYCSDHGDVPGLRRKPLFNGFRMTRIPLFVWLSEEYILCHPDRAKALANNRDRYFTNDLLYELLCGVLDAKSPNFDTSNSLAYDNYRWQRDELLTYEGRHHISEDDVDADN